MSETPPDEHPAEENGDSAVSPRRVTRLRRFLRRLDPAQFGLLGLLSIPGYLVDSLAFMQVFALFFLCFFWIWTEPIVDRLLQNSADAEREPTDWIHMGSWREWALAYLMLPVTLVNPLVLAQDGLQFLGSAVAYARHRGSVPAPNDDHDRQVSYRLPVAGTWTVFSGSRQKEFSHSWVPLTQRYAYDFIVTDEDGRSRPEGTSPAIENYYCYDEPVLAPADGVVVDVCDTEFESSRGGGVSHPVKRDLRGNYVTIQHAADAYSCLAHLVPGSVAVEPGDRVDRGQPIGRCGHSGNSGEPHLHFQLQDHPTFELAAGVPARFEVTEVESPWLDDGGAATIDETTTSGDRTAITAGQRVTGEAVSERVPESADRAGKPSIADDRSPLAVTRDRIATLQRVAFGAIVGALLTIAVGIVAGMEIAPIALGAASLAGVGFWLVARRWQRVRRPGAIGTSIGLALVAVLWAVLPAVRSASVFLVAGIVGYVLLGEYDRVRHERAYRDGEPLPDPEPEQPAGT